MKKVLAGAAALAALAGAIVVGAGPASSADSGPMAYTVIDQGDGTCDLATLDLGTGELTDLPAESSIDACVADLAVSPEGVVMGISQTGILGQGLAPAAPVQSDIQFVTFDATGAPFLTPIFIDDIPDGASLSYGGIAVGPAGVYFQAYLGETNTSCDAGIALCLLTYDPETGVGTPIGGSTKIDQSMWQLTYCASGMHTLAIGEGLLLDTVDPSTGVATDGPAISTAVSGMDCAVGSSPLWAISGTQQSISGLATPAAVAASVGTIDPATGTLTTTVAVSDPTADLYLLAVMPQVTPPTTPTTAGPAVAADVVPAFTG